MDLFCKKILGNWAFKILFASCLCIYMCVPVYCKCKIFPKMNFFKVLHLVGLKANACNNQAF